ncbi:cysteine desulfurase family protein [Streptococcus thoraltensis]
MIYLDNAATTPLTESVIAEMTQAMTLQLANPSSIHTHGRLASQKLREYRQTVASLLSTTPNNIIFTSGGTESNNTALKGYALAHQEKGKHIITSALEHHSVLHTLEYLEKHFGFEVTYLQPVNGGIRLEDLRAALREDTILVSLMYANNETGDMLPIAEVGDLLKDHSAAFHVDAVQVAGKILLEPEKLGIDFMSISAHKFHGPKGVGILYNNRMLFDPLLHGGEQEDKHRASTENLIGIAGMTKALADSHDHLDENWNKVTRLNQAFLEQLSGLDFYLNSKAKAIPHVLNIGFPGANNGVLLTQLDLQGYSVSTGSACTAGTVDPSHVLAAKYGDDSPKLQESIRISFSELNTEEEVIGLANLLKSLLGD